MNQVVFNTIALLIGAVALILFVQVFLRYVLHAPLTWSEEVAKYLSIWIVFLGMAVAMRRMLLIAVEAVVQSVPERIGHAMRLLSLGLVMVFVGYLAYIGIGLTSGAADQDFASLELPMSIVYAAIPVGSFLTLMNAIVVFIEMIGERSVKI
ncbi:MAG: TRAP transporter small permease [Castellaniella sp.]|uniref:TRAP transporter small permease protein n=1 Tax=Castellaniella hirudinis TaxID=1144617 RepID=A0ABV8RWY5_9BURK